MIASFLHNFIFVKTRKTAGTSLEIVLSSWCGERDIITPIAAVDELARAKIGGMPRNFAASPEVEASYIEAVRAGRRREIHQIRKYMRDNPTLRGYHAHMPATTVRSMQPELWNRAFKFTIERHPYEKVVSRAYWNANADKDDRPIKKIIDEVIESPRLSDRYIYADGDKVIVDKIFPFENLWAEIAEFAKSLGKSLPDELPRAKSQIRRDKRPAHELLTFFQKRRIAKKCAFEFELMGYQR